MVTPPPALTRYRRAWAESFDKLDDYLAKLQAAKVQDGKRKPSH